MRSQALCVLTPPAVLGIVALAISSSALGQGFSFTGVGTLGGATSRCENVARVGDMIVVTGKSLDGDGKEQAFIWTSANGMKGLGFLDPQTYVRSEGYGVDIDSEGTVHVAGTLYDGGDVPRAFYWYGDTAVPGTGTMQTIPLLTGGNKNWGRSLRVKAGTDEVFVAGTSTVNIGGGLYRHAYRWRTGAPGAALDLGDIAGSSNKSEGFDMGWTPSNGENIYVGYSKSTWWVSGPPVGNAEEAFRWYSFSGNILGRKGLDYVCGRGFQIAAGPDGQADTTAHGGDIQVEAVGTSGLDPEDIVVSSGADQWLQTEHAGARRADDDTLRPEGHAPANGNDEFNSYFYAISRHARFSVGASTYPPMPSEGGVGPCRPVQACMRDVSMKDGEPGPDHCGGNVMHFGLGFLPGDNESIARDVSTTASYNTRDGMVVVGYSRIRDTDICDPVTDSRALVWFINGSYDNFDIELETHNLKTYLENHGLDLTGWELREARGVSDDGTIVSGWGVHNGVEEGFLASFVAGPVGACCRPDGSCVEALGIECTDLGGKWQGGGTTCDQVVCCVDPFADVDADGDVDQRDFAAFQRCITGDLPPGPLPAECACLDHDGDGNIDGDDLGFFTLCASGPEIPADVTCDDPR